MKSRLLSVLLMVAATLVSTSAWAQSFHHLFSSDGTDVWAAGHGGLLYRSLDGGQTWTQRTVGAADLYGVAAIGFRVLAVGDGGNTWRSSDSGGNWDGTIVAGAPQLRALAMPALNAAYAVGQGGTIVKSVDGGATWSPQPSGTGALLRDVHFTDATHGWAVGDAGTVLHTVNGGTSWTPVAVGTTQNLLAVDQNGSTVWVVGENAVARRSTNDGANWDPVNLELDDLADVDALALVSPTEVYLSGGGGFIRHSTDNGANWTFQRHAMHAEMRDLFFVGSAGWACNHDNGVILYTSDGGDTWHFPSGAGMSRSWENRTPSQAYGTVRGGTISNHPTDKHTFFAAIGNKVIRSTDDGENWSIINTIPTGSSSRCNAFIVSPKNPDMWLAAIDSSDVDRVMRTTNGGGNWTRSLYSGNPNPLHFGTYGIPLEMHPDNPDTVYFGADNDDLWRTTDFGLSWTRISTSPSSFRSPCDILVIPGNSNTILLADGVTASGRADFFRSTDGGVTFNLELTLPINASESPGLAGGRLRKTDAFGTSWALGNFYRTSDSGNSWDLQTVESNAWGVDVAKDDPDVVIFGRFSGGRTLLSLDGGDTFTNVTITGNNYSFYARDRKTILAEQSDGIYKMRFSYSNSTTSSQSLALLSPNGGETWMSGDTHPISWNASNVAVARIEFQSTVGGPWQVVADVPGYEGSYDWLVPSEYTTEARIRVRDLWDSSPRDSSDTRFTISGPLAVGDPTPGRVELYQNQPNPFDGSTTIRYALPAEAEVALDVFDIQGHRVAALVRGAQAPGAHTVRFGHDMIGADGRPIGRLQAGVYFYRLRAGGFSATRKMLLTK